MHTSVDGHVRIHDLVFSLTRQCNAYCDFCCNDDGPDKRGVIDPAAARQWIRDFAAYVPYCRTAGFTGGEVFLRYKEMEEIHQSLHQYGFRTSITTNGFWGKSPDLARKRLLQLKSLGLTEIAVSIDPSHTDWVPVEHSTAAVKIALECGLLVAVTSHFKTAEGSAKDYFEPDYHPFIIWDESHYVLPVGRAKHLPKESFSVDQTEGPLRCPRVQLVVQPNGDVDPCCSVCLDDGVFVVGNLYRQTMPEVLVAMLGDMYLKTITHRGLHELERIVQRYYASYKLPENRYSVCFMCNALRKDASFWMVEDAMRQYGLDLIIENMMKERVS